MEIEVVSYGWNSVLSTVHVVCLEKKQINLSKKKKWRVKKNFLQSKASKTYGALKNVRVSPATKKLKEKLN